MLNDEMFEVISSKESENGTIVEVLEFKDLSGSSDVRTAESLFFAKEAGMKLKMVRIKIKNSKVRLEPGALYYMKGSLEMKASSGGGILKGMKRKMLSGESFFVNEIKGSGEIYLEPSFGHFFLETINKENKALIVDKGMFYAGTENLDINAVMQKNISSAVFGGEGLFQTEVKGTGIAILFSKVPRCEVQEIKLENEKLSVDGNFALMRTEGIKFKVEKSSKSWLATSVSGEGLLQTFEGTGTVWIAPTEKTYKGLRNFQSIGSMATPQK